jgi:hypothetical protein
MQRKGIPMLYERAASQVPSLYVQWRWTGAFDSMLPERQLSQYNSSLLQQADSRPDSGTGSRLFEINLWMWRYGRNFPRQISVDQAV